MTDNSDLPRAPIPPILLAGRIGGLRGWNSA